MIKNVYYLSLGVVLGAILGSLVCDDTKKKITKAIQSKAKKLSGCIKSLSEETVHAING
ncbi:hypothetical protein [Cardinium endosymbiont of Bemisia tabaci]|uniref:hypothetical protein n=1 Tax=Cardinium endosymbiont of Bemisia tabaci TaxID=672794 RepID=UPI000442D049|nr:hypothetical protein [Cardinium endosymbiont of Bemisia tabaci]CDG49636.1 Hypothetical protein CHV_a0321 [Cardinium endosymbiont cBtQ1 of Bemisia tabaci]